MKKSLMILLIVLGAIVKNYAEVTKEEKVILAPDKSKIFVVKKTEIIMRTINGKRIEEDITRVYDTTETYSVIDEAEKYLNDSVASLLLTNGSVSLSDSLVPRWTHLFGEDKYISRKLRILYDVIYVSRGFPKYVPAVNRITFYCFIIMFLCGFIISFVLLRVGGVRDIVFILLIVVLLVFIFCSCEARPNTIFDIFFGPLASVFPSLLLAIFAFRKKERKNKL